MYLRIAAVAHQLIALTDFPPLATGPNKVLLLHLIQGAEVLAPIIIQHHLHRLPLPAPLLLHLRLQGHQPRHPLEGVEQTQVEDVFKLTFPVVQETALHRQHIDEGHLPHQLAHTQHYAPMILNPFELRHELRLHRIQLLHRSGHCLPLADLPLQSVRLRLQLPLDLGDREVGDVWVEAVVEEYVFGEEAIGVIREGKEIEVDAKEEIKQGFVGLCSDEGGDRIDGSVQEDKWDVGAGGRGRVLLQGCEDADGVLPFADDVGEGAELVRQSQQGVQQGRIGVEVCAVRRQLKGVETRGEGHFAKTKVAEGEVWEDGQFIQFLHAQKVYEGDEVEVVAFGYVATDVLPDHRTEGVHVLHRGGQQEDYVGRFIVVCCLDVVLENEDVCRRKELVQFQTH